MTNPKSPHLWFTKLSELLRQGNVIPKLAPLAWPDSATCQGCVLVDPKQRDLTQEKVQMRDQPQQTMGKLTLSSQFLIGFLGGG